MSSHEYPVSLPYPNPSLSQVGGLEEGATTVDRSSSSTFGLQKHSVSGPRQVVLVLS